MGDELIMNGAANESLNESWGIWSARRDMYDDATWAGAGYGVGGPYYTNRRDREDGHNRPLIETEIDLAWIRGVGRYICDEYELGKAITGALENYVVGTGFGYTVVPRQRVGGRKQRLQDVPPQMIETLQAALDELVEEAGWTVAMEKELLRRGVRDGERFLRVVNVGNEYMSLQFIEPEHVTEPADPGAIEAWLGCSEEFVSSWTFGVHTRKEDLSRLLGVHCVRDNVGADWDYLAAAEVGHSKRNVDAAIHRGISDFWPVWDRLVNVDKLQTNTEDGSAIQASIAYIVEAASGTTQQQASAFSAATNTATIQQPTQNGVREVGTRKLQGVRRLVVPAGQQYKPGPMGSERAPQFLNVVQAGVRRVASRWNMPEYLISGDASNANYASTLVAESPFVKACESEQKDLADFMQAVWKKALKRRYASGQGAARYLQRYSWEEIARVLDIKVELSSVATRDTQAQVVVQQAQLGMGVISRRTIATQSGLDYDDEVAAGAAPQAAPAALAQPAATTPPAAPTGEARAVLDG